jgi:hypothetical protein
MPREEVAVIRIASVILLTVAYATPARAERGTAFNPTRPIQTSARIEVWPGSTAPSWAASGPAWGHRSSPSSKCCGSR